MNSELIKDFPILSREVHKRPLVYFDNGATTQKPRCVVEAMVDEYYNVNANVHRGVHFLSQQATDLHEGAREAVRRFINAGSTREVIFTRGTTEAINLVASTLPLTWGEDVKGAEVIISTMEHHSNIVPWQLQAERLGLKLRVIPMSDDGILDIEAYRQLFTDKTRLVSCTHVSNVLGTVNPVKKIIDIAHEHGVPCLIDGAQSAPHMKIDVQALDCDFYAFSGHKMYGPTGVGVLYGKEKWLEMMPPYQGGGDMIGTVTFEKTTYADLPYKFEAGTPDYVATHGLATAISYLENIGMDKVLEHEKELTRYAMEQMLAIDGMHIYGPSDVDIHDAVISFQLGDIHHLDMGTLLDQLGIAVRTGHHCAEPLMRRLNIPGTCRASFGLYNTKEEIDVFVKALKRIQGMF